MEQYAANMAKVASEERHNAIEVISMIAGYLDKVGRDDLADNLMGCLEILK